MNKYEPVIGLEVHVELNTKSKMFCQCSADYFGKEPNTHTCPVCLGLPGALPFINKQAIEGCIKIGLALNCLATDKALFERKNYFYPDLPKGYQISQYRWPQTVNGWIEVENDKGEKTKIRINRAHQEEDTAKLVHQFGILNDKLQISNEDKNSYVDFNRSGVPLVEIVTEPDFTDSSQIRDYAKKLQQIFRYLGVSNADMERGDMRLEANISVREVDESLASHLKGGRLNPKDLPPYRVELKNINSFRFMVAAVEYEIKRQIELLEAGKDDQLKQETRGWDEDKKITYVQRSKEEAHDYRYFPEPDLPELKLTSELVNQLTSQIPELPWKKVNRFVEAYGLKEKDSKILCEDKELADIFEKVVKIGREEEIEPKALANYVINQKIDLLNEDSNQIIDNIKAKSAGVISDEGELEKVCLEVIKENPDAAESYQKGKLGLLQFLIGKVMGKTGGKAEAGKVKKILEIFLK